MSENGKRLGKLVFLFPVLLVTILVAYLLFTLVKNHQYEAIAPTSGFLIVGVLLLVYYSYRIIFRGGLGLHPAVAFGGFMLLTFLGLFLSGMAIPLLLGSREMDLSPEGVFLLLFTFVLPIVAFLIIIGYGVPRYRELAHKSGAALVAILFFFAAVGSIYLRKAIVGGAAFGMFEIDASENFFGWVVATFGLVLCGIAALNQGKLIRVADWFKRS